MIQKNAEIVKFVTEKLLDYADGGIKKGAHIELNPNVNPQAVAIKVIEILMEYEAKNKQREEMAQLVELMGKYFPHEALDFFKNKQVYE